VIRNRRKSVVWSEEFNCDFSWIISVGWWVKREWGSFFFYLKSKSAILRRKLGILRRFFYLRLNPFVLCARNNFCARSILCITVPLILSSMFFCPIIPGVHFIILGNSLWRVTSNEFFFFCFSLFSYLNNTCEMRDKKK
jgi:hypothetical protein